MSVRGLHKIIYPFAPDQSGAASVLYELGGMIIICDAGGCAGNVCGFDEPRWLRTKSAVFSAGLRDMDAILGRDDLLIEKITSASEKLQSKFIAILGTPVPATIATDYKALRRMAEKRTGLPVITIDTNGIRWYDDGISKAYREMFRRFAVDGADGDGDRTDVISDSAGVIGASPLDTGYLDAGSRIREILRSRGITESVCYGSGDTLEKTADARRMEKNIVISAAGLKAARYLRDRFGTPYICEDLFIETVMSELEASCLEETGHELYSELEGKRVLVMHQQVRSNAVRERIRDNVKADVTVGTWFMMDEELKEEGDIRIRDEAAFMELMENGGFDAVIADGSFRKALRHFGITLIDLPHFAVSGKLSE
ncbi:MAG: nitrogenase molybdenum-iron protein [Clostridiales bacterium]|nr:nitrogenase molybdenum-iron protein [Clostridiales bacterium]